jgi:hypothetical protein
VYLSLRRFALQTPDPEFAEEGENEIEITDLVSSTGTGKVSGKFASWSQVPTSRARAWMSIAMIAGIALLVFTVLENVSHVAKAGRVNVQPVQMR